MGVFLRLSFQATQSQRFGLLYVSIEFQEALVSDHWLL